MAEKFEDVVNKLGKATKKPSQSKAPIVVAVQLVDDKGKVIKEDSGAAVTEEKREALNREKKRIDLLKRIAEALIGEINNRNASARKTTAVSLELAVITFK